MSKFRETNYSIVLESQCDELGHMNIQYYFAALSDTMFKFMSIVGVPTSEISIRKTSFVLFKQDSEFIEELYAQYVQNPESISSQWKEFFDGLREGVVMLRELFDANLDQQTMAAEHFSGHWSDVGTPDRLEQLNRE